MAQPRPEQSVESDIEADVVPESSTSASSQVPEKISTYVTDIAPPLPVNTIHSVRVCHIEDGPMNFYLQLMTSFDSMLPQLDELLHFNVSAPTNILHPGSVIMARASDGTLRRAVLTKADFDSCEVYYVDYGNYENLTYSDIFHLSRQAAEFSSALALQFCLADIETLVITSADKEEFARLLLGKEVLIQVTEKPPHGPFQYCHLLYDGKSMREILVENNTPNLSYQHHCTPSNNEYVTVAFCEGPSQFYVHSLSELGTILKIEDELGKYCCRQPRLEDTSSLRIGEPVAACHSDESKWCRGLVMNIISGDRINIFFVDYGEHVEVDVNELCFISSYLVNKWCMQATECCLFGFNHMQPSKDLKKKMSYIVEDRCFKLEVHSMVGTYGLCVDLIDDQGISTADIILAMLYGKREAEKTDSRLVPEAGETDSRLKPEAEETDSRLVPEAEETDSRLAPEKDENKQSSSNDYKRSSQRPSRRESVKIYQPPALRNRSAQDGSQSMTGRNERKGSQKPYFDSVQGPPLCWRTESRDNAGRFLTEDWRNRPNEASSASKPRLEPDYMKSERNREGCGLSDNRPEGRPKPVEALDVGMTRFGGNGGGFGDRERTYGNRGRANNFEDGNERPGREDGNGRGRSRERDSTSLHGTPQILGSIEGCSMALDHLTYAPQPLTSDIGFHRNAATPLAKEDIRASTAGLFGTDPISLNEQSPSPDNHVQPSISCDEQADCSVLSLNKDCSALSQSADNVDPIQLTALSDVCSVTARDLLANSLPSGEVAVVDELIELNSSDIHHCHQFNNSVDATSQFGVSQETLGSVESPVDQHFSIDPDNSDVTGIVEDMNDAQSSHPLEISVMQTGVELIGGAQVESADQHTFENCFEQYPSMVDQYVPNLRAKLLAIDATINSFIELIDSDDHPTDTQTMSEHLSDSSESGLLTPIEEVPISGNQVQEVPMRSATVESTNLVEVLCTTEELIEPSLVSPSHQVNSIEVTQAMTQSSDNGKSSYPCSSPEVTGVQDNGVEVESVGSAPVESTDELSPKECPAMVERLGTNLEAKLLAIDATINSFIELIDSDDHPAVTQTTSYDSEEFRSLTPILEVPEAQENSEQDDENFENSADVESTDEPPSEECPEMVELSPSLEAKYLAIDATVSSFIELIDSSDLSADAETISSDSEEFLSLTPEDYSADAETISSDSEEFLSLTPEDYSADAETISSGSEEFLSLTPEDFSTDPQTISSDLEEFLSLTPEDFSTDAQTISSDLEEFRSLTPVLEIPETQENSEQVDENSEKSALMESIDQPAVEETSAYKRHNLIPTYQNVQKSSTFFQAALPILVDRRKSTKSCPLTPIPEVAGVQETFDEVSVRTAPMKFPDNPTVGELPKDVLTEHFSVVQQVPNRFAATRGKLPEPQHSSKASDSRPLKPIPEVDEIHEQCGRTMRSDPVESAVDPTVGEHSEDAPASFYHSNDSRNFILSAQSSGASDDDHKNNSTPKMSSPSCPVPTAEKPVPFTFYIKMPIDEREVRCGLVYGGQVGKVPVVKAPLKQGNPENPTETSRRSDENALKLRSSPAKEDEIVPGCVLGNV